MNTPTFRSLALVAIMLHLSVLPAFAQQEHVAAATDDDLTPAPAPGKVIRINFPELPDTLLANVTGNDIPTAVLVRIPDNYNAEDTFPLYVFLEGGHGGAGSNIAVPMRISNGGDGVIVASFPLFKKKYDSGQRWPFVVGVEDVQTLSSAYKVILDRLREIIPNIDADRSIIGGHSNGAKAIAVLLSGLDQNILDSFRGFFFIDGGMEWTSVNRPKVLGQHHIFFLVGEGSEDERRIEGRMMWRRHTLQRVAYYRDVAAYHEVTTWRFETFEGVGHEFAEQYYEVLREWAKTVGTDDDAQEHVREPNG